MLTRLMTFNQSLRGMSNDFYTTLLFPRFSLLYVHYVLRPYGYRG